MKTANYLSIIFLVNAFLLNAQNCIDTISVSMYKDSIKHSYRLMEQSIAQDSTCLVKTVVFDQIATLDFSLVYEASFYVQNEGEATINITFMAEDKSSKTFEYSVLNKGSKYHRFALDWYGLENQLTNKRITSVIITLTSKATIYMDEISFYFLEQENSLAINKAGIDIKRLKDIENKKEEIESDAGARIQSKKNKEFQLR